MPIFSLQNRVGHHLGLLVMGLTKQYLRYAPSALFGVIGSQKANIAYVTLRGGEKGRYVAVAACEHVFVWDIRKGEKVRPSTFYHLLKTHKLLRQHQISSLTHPLVRCRF